MTVALELFLIVLLMLSIGYGVVLNRRITALRRDQKNLEKLAASFSKATQRAESGVAQLKSATHSSVTTLQEVIGRADGLRRDLEFLIDRGEGTADSLERAVRRAERAPRETPADDRAPSAVVESFPERRRKAAADGGDNAEDAERQLIKALRAVR